MQSYAKQTRTFRGRHLGSLLRLQEQCLFFYIGQGRIGDYWPECAHQHLIPALDMAV